MRKIFSVILISSLFLATSCIFNNKDSTTSQPVIPTIPTTPTVDVSAVDTIKISPSSAEIKVGCTQQFTATCKNINNEIIQNAQITWSSKSTAVATINSLGLAKGVKAGTAIISASTNNKSSTAVLDVTNNTNVIDTSNVSAQTAPDFTLPDINNKSVSLSDFSGKVIILDFWATWCGYCVKEVPHLVELYNTYKEKGLVIIGIDVDTDEDAAMLKSFASKQGITYPILLGNKNVTDSYGGVRGIPTSFIIDRNQKIVQTYVGYRDKSTFENAIKDLL